jgi:hypothetical protein
MKNKSSNINLVYTKQKQTYSDIDIDLDLPVTSLPVTSLPVTSLPVTSLPVTSLPVTSLPVNLVIDLSDNSVNFIKDISENTLKIIKDISENIINNKNVNFLLEKVRINCVQLTAYHNKRYHRYRRFLFIIFRIPLICLSSCNGFLAVGAQGYMSQEKISLTNALLSIFCGILTSVELLLNLQKRMETELDSYKNYYKLSIEIYKFLKMDILEQDSKIGAEYLELVYAEYEKYLYNGNAINRYDHYMLDELEQNNIYDTDVNQIKLQISKHSCNMCERCYLL